MTLSRLNTYILKYGTNKFKNYLYTTTNNINMCEIEQIETKKICLPSLKIKQISQIKQKTPCQHFVTST